MEQPELDRRDFPLFASITGRDLQDILEESLHQVLYTDGLDQLPGINQSLDRIATCLEALVAKEVGRRLQEPTAQKYPPYPDSYWTQPQHAGVTGGLVADAAGNKIKFIAGIPQRLLTEFVEAWRLLLEVESTMKTSKAPKP